MAETTKSLTIEKALDRELKKFTPEDDLKDLAKESLDYTVLSVHDKEGYETVVEQRKRVVKARTGIDKVRKQIKAPVIAFGKDVDAMAKMLTEIIEPAEEHLKAQEKIYTDELERIEQQKEAARLELIRVRTERLFECKPNPTADGYNVGPHTISRREIEMLSDTDFDVRLEAMVEFFNRKSKEDAEVQAKLDRLAELEAKEKERELEAAKAAAEAKMSTAVKAAIDGVKAEADFDPFDEPTEGKRGVPDTNPLIRDEAADMYHFDVQTDVSKELVDEVIRFLLTNEKDDPNEVAVLETLDSTGHTVQITIGRIRNWLEFKKLWDVNSAKA